MNEGSQSRIGLVLLVWGLGLTASASAQMAPPPAPSSTPPASMMMMNPYFNPYMNPLLNPSAPQQKLSTGNSLLYLYSAQASRGGLGSGRLSNPGTTNRKKPATVPNSASVPGGAAAGYFGNSRSGSRAGLNNYYNKRTGRFQNNGN